MSKITQIQVEDFIRSHPEFVSRYGIKFDPNSKEFNIHRPEFIGSSLTMLQSIEEHEYTFGIHFGSCVVTLWKGVTISHVSIFDKVIV